MADNFLNKTGLQYFYNRIKTKFAKQTDLDALDTKVDEIIAEGGEPNVIETDGTLKCARYSTGASAIAVPNNAWLNINSTYISAT